MTEDEWKEAMKALRALAGPEVIATTWVRAAGGGGSEPHVWLADDGAEYHVKLRNNPQGLTLSLDT